MTDALAILSLADAKAHLRVDGEDDASITQMISAAVAAVEDFLGRPLIDDDLGWPSAAEVPANIVHAVKVVLTSFYDDRATPIADMATVRNLVGRYVVVSLA